MAPVGRPDANRNICHCDYRVLGDCGTGEMDCKENEMYLKYLKYIIKHKWFVFIECVKLKKIWLGIIHDWSKFRPSEFIPYARYFYGSYLPYSKYIPNRRLYKEDIERQFDKAWLFHIHRNKHHWQFWLLQEDDGPLKNIPIPVRYLKEMIADWRGAGKAITGKDCIQEWYGKNKNNINLNRINKAWVERAIDKIFKREERNGK